MNRTIVSMAAAALLVVGLVTAPVASAAGRPTCLVSNERSDYGARSLQSAIDAAEPGDTLVVKGTCVGPSTITKNLSLVGVSNPAFGTATLDGAEAGSVVTIQARSVAFRSLTITNGTAVIGGGIRIAAANTVTLVDVTVTGNSATSGGGVYNHGAILTVTDSAVTANTALKEGGGISTDHGRVTVDGTSSVDRNTATVGGGISHHQSALLTLKDRSAIHHNTASQDGGGINIGDAGMTVSDESSIHHNTAGGHGGGVWVSWNAGASMTGASSIRANTAGAEGGGVYVFSEGTPVHVRLYDASTIAGNVPDEWYPLDSVVRVP